MIPLLVILVLFDTYDTNPKDLSIVLRKDTRSYASKHKYHIYQFVSSKNHSPQYQVFIGVADFVRISLSIQESLQDKNEVEAMNDEMKVLEKNGSWEIVERQ